MNMGYALIQLFNAIIDLYVFIIIVMAVLSWLIAFNILNERNGFVYQVLRFVNAVTEPVLNPIRRVLPSLGGVDLSPIVLILGLQFLKTVVNRSLAGPLITWLG